VHIRRPIEPLAENYVGLPTEKFLNYIERHCDAGRRRCTWWRARIWAALAKISAAVTVIAAPTCQGVGPSAMAAAFGLSASASSAMTRLAQHGDCLGRQRFV